MTVRAYLRDPKRPVVFMPVYFGYERIVEGRTYIGELSGQPKQKESVFVLLKAIVSVLRSKFGKVHVNLGQPIALDDAAAKAQSALASAILREHEDSPRRLDRRSHRRAGRAHQHRDQRGRRRDADQPGGHGDLWRRRARRCRKLDLIQPGRAVPAAAARCAVLAAGDGNARQRLRK